MLARDDVLMLYPSDDVVMYIYERVASQECRAGRPHPVHRGLLSHNEAGQVMSGLQQTTGSYFIQPKVHVVFWQIVSF